MSWENILKLKINIPPRAAALLDNIMQDGVERTASQALEAIHDAIDNYETHPYFMSRVRQARPPKKGTQYIPGTIMINRYFKFSGKYTANGNKFTWSGEE